MPDVNTDPLIPAGLPLVEYQSINWVLCTIKERVLSGEPSGRVLDRAIDEVLERATDRSYSGLSVRDDSSGESPS